MTPMQDARAADPKGTGPIPVQRERVIDPLTGLPLLRYRFVGEARLQAQQEVPEGVWRVLRVQAADDRTTVDTETTGNTVVLRGRAAMLDDALLDRLLNTLSVIAGQGLVHGDLGADRVQLRGSQLWLEGYGVPWRDDANTQQDVVDLARSLLDLQGSSLSAGGRRRLAAVIASGDPLALAGQLTPNTEAQLLATSLPPTPQAAQPPKASFVKAPPPGSTVRSGEPGPLELVQNEVATAVGRSVASPEARRRRLMLIALLIGVAALASLSLYAQQRQGAATASPGPVLTTGFLVNATVLPVGMPPVSLVVLESPSGSRLSPGSVVGTVPNRILLDRAGVWRFEARFRDQRSAQARIVLPEQRELALVFPEPLDSSIP